MNEFVPDFAPEEFEENREESSRRRPGPTRFPCENLPGCSQYSSPVWNSRPVVVLLETNCENDRRHLSLGASGPWSRYTALTSLSELSSC
jgi:hypothetical protein